MLASRRTVGVNGALDCLTLSSLLRRTFEEDGGHDGSFPRVTVCLLKMLIRSRKRLVVVVTSQRLEQNQRELCLVRH